MGAMGAMGSIGWWTGVLDIFQEKLGPCGCYVPVFVTLRYQILPVISIYVATYVALWAYMLPGSF